MAQVDIFSPFRRQPEYHEDRLTWGFLVLLKYAPSLQTHFRNLILDHIPNDRWDLADVRQPASISTQTNTLGSETAFVVSVLLSDAYMSESLGVAKSDRNARYDGVIEFDDGFVVIIENKPRAADVRPDQLSPSIASFQDLPEEIELYEKAVSIEWATVLECVLGYTGSQSAPYAERTLAHDFLAFAEELHPNLSPYRTFRLCGSNTDALSKRIERLLESIGKQIDAPVEVRPGGQRFLQLSMQAVRQLHISPPASDEDGLIIRQSIWPADTVAQARAFLSNVERDAFLDLPRQGWQIRSNLHFSHVQKHLVWADTSLSYADYLHLFQSESHRVGRVRFEEVSLEALIADLRANHLISRADEDKLRSTFGETRRSYLNVIPGFQLIRDWPLAEVMALEESGELEKRLLDALRIPLRTWHEEVPPAIDSA